MSEEFPQQDPNEMPSEQHQDEQRVVDIDREHTQALASAAIHDKGLEFRDEIKELEALKKEAWNNPTDIADIKSRASELGVEFNPRKAQPSREIRDFVESKREEVKGLKDLAHKAEEWAGILYDGNPTLDLDGNDYYDLLGYSREDGSGILVDSLGGNVQQVRSKALEHLLNPVTLARREQYLERRKSVIKKVREKLNVESEHPSYDDILNALPRLSPLDPSEAVIEAFHMLDQNESSGIMDGSRDFGYKRDQLKRGVTQHYDTWLSEDDKDRFRRISDARDRYGLVSLYEALGTPARPYDNTTNEAVKEVHNVYTENGKDFDYSRHSGIEFKDDSITYGQLSRIYRALVAERLLVDFEGYDKAVNVLDKLKGQSSNTDS